MNKPSTHRSILSVAGLLAACCLGLGGCGDSSTSGADKRVKQASDEAARIAASAGAYRPTDAFMDKVKSAGWQPADQTALDKSLKAPLNGIKESAAVDKYMATLLKKATVEQDLKTAIEKLNASLTGDAPSDGTFSLGQTQLGNTNSELASVELDQASAAVLDLVRKSVEVQSKATEIAEIEAAAGLGESTKGAYQAALDTKVNGAYKEAKDAADAAAAELKTSTDALAALQSQMADKRKEGQEARVQAAEFLGKSNQAKGDDGLKYYDQVAEATTKAATALSEASKLQPAVDVATVQLHEAEVKATTTADVLKAITELKSQMEQTVSGAVASTDKFKADAQKLLNDKQTGYTTAVADFNASADAASAMLSKIGALAKTAQDSYSKAQAALEKYRRNVAEMHRDPSDPVARGVANRQMDNLLSISSAAALNRSAQAHLLIAHVAQMKEQVAAARTGGVASVDGAAAERKLALADFQAAAAKVKPFTTSADMKGTPIVWISSLLLAVSEEGSSLASTRADVKVHHDLAVKAASDAETLNALVVVHSTAPVRPE